MSKDRLISVLSLVAALALGAYVCWDALGEAFTNPLMVQDDFRQSHFWIWKFWDSSLFPNDFYLEMYQSLLVRTPALHLLMQFAPSFSPDPIIFSKVLALVLSLLSTIAAFLFAKAKTRSNSIAVFFAFILSVCFWCTDHVSAAQTRSFIWLGLLAYMFFKAEGRNLATAFTTFILLLTSPITFLICLTMEGFSYIWKHGTKAFDFTESFKPITKNIEVYSALINVALTLLIYKVIYADVTHQGVGHAFSRAEMMKLPEFNPGGRHPIFGSNLTDGSWWTNEHWGLGIGYLKISLLIKIALAVGVVYLFIKAFDSSTKFTAYLKHLTERHREIVLLFASSAFLFSAAQVVFPMLYMPSRYIAISALLISVYVLITIITRLLSKIKTPIISIVAMVIIALGFFNYFKKHYFARFVSMDAKIHAQIKQLPKDALIAGHPLSPEINSASMLAKRMVFADYERGMAYTKESLAVIRKRHVDNFKMIYAPTQESLQVMMREAGVTHILAYRYFYLPQYLNQASYLEPYNQVLRQIIAASPKYFLNELLSQQRKNVAIISIDDLS